MAEKQTTKKLAAIRIRGIIHSTMPIRHTLENLNLHNRNTLAIFNDSESVRGMMKKVKDYVTWGEVDAETEEQVIAKRAQFLVDKDGKKVQLPFYRLSPPKKGYGRKGIKDAFASGGALGYRGEKINDLIKRML